MKDVITVGKAMLKTLGVVAGVPILDDFVESLEVSLSLRVSLCACVMFLINHLIAALFDKEGPRKVLWSPFGLDQALFGGRRIEDATKNEG